MLEELWSYCSPCERWFFERATTRPLCPECLQPGLPLDDPAVPVPPAALAG